MNSVEITALVISTLVGSGGFATVIRFGTRLSLVERMVETSQLTSLHPRLTLVESAVQEIKLALVDLKHLPRIVAQLEGLQEAVRELKHGPHA